MKTDHTSVNEVNAKAIKSLWKKPELKIIDIADTKGTGGTPDGDGDQPYAQKKPKIS